MIQHIYHEMKFIGFGFRVYIEERVCKKGLSFFQVINIIPHNLVLLYGSVALTMCLFYF